MLCVITHPPPKKKKTMVGSTAGRVRWRGANHDDARGALRVQDVAVVVQVLAAEVQVLHDEDVLVPVGD